MREIRINVRTTADIKHDIAITAKTRGMSVSSLINELAVSVIREEKKFNSAPFKRADAKTN